MEDLERVLEAHSGVSRKKRDGEAIFNETQFNFMILKIYNIFLPLLALSHPKVIRPKTRRPAGENYVYI